ncbi:Conserved_hypothetical protein [Hexamita inflata]|uniref:Uncharacterized protein n=1 Tax=Hexamita inflata TaxID=28002 RepID=A0AA86NWT0_9EUKA|nr:Conserved hypothetical protein [Hexamita inflata]
MQIINCSRINGNTIINGTCVHTYCSIEGQYYINGICQCININEVVINNSCKCPDTSILVGNVCMCTSSDQIIRENLCECRTSGAFINDGVCTCGQHALNISNQCQCPLQSQLINASCICDIYVGLTMIDGQCQCTNGSQLVNGQCLENIFVINGTNNLALCSQQIFITSFDIQQVTDQVIINYQNFSNGYIFSTSQYLQNSFIDVSNNVYNQNVKPLFQSQYQFYNIKIQIGQSVVNNSALLSYSTTIHVNQVNIISKDSTTITVNSGYQFNILLQQSTQTNISNLLINLSFATPQFYGLITLIGSISGVASINKYQISGIYQSSGMVALISIKVNSSTITISHINFMPTTYTVGNCSSYLLSNITNCVVNISFITIQIGNIANQKLINAISYSSSFYQFGGLISSFSNISAIIIQILSDNVQKFSQQNVANSGLLIGQSYNSNNIFVIQNLCLQQLLVSNTRLDTFGIIGQYNGNISLQQCQITFNVSGTLAIFGLIGKLQSQCNYSEIQNIVTTVNTLGEFRSTISSALIGYQMSKNCSIQHILVNNSNIQLLYYSAGIIGIATFKQILVINEVNISNCNFISKNQGSGQTSAGLIGMTEQSTLSVQNTFICNVSIISVDKASGGILGHISDSVVNIINSNISTVNLTSGSYVGIVIGYSRTNNSFDITNSKSLGTNYINNIKQSNCASITDVLIPRGC